MVLHSPIPTAVGFGELGVDRLSSSGAAAEAADCESARPPSLLARILHCEFQAICCSRCSLDARRLFDGMPPGEAPPPTGGDRIGGLPDGVLQHILGFLPPHEAVRTCVLARRWRHLWKSVAALRITNWDWRKVVPMEEFRYFVHHLLLRRGRAPIDEFELDLAELSDRDTLRVNRWFPACSDVPGPGATAGYPCEQGIRARARKPACRLPALAKARSLWCQIDAQFP
ncbi:hypothetical protein OsI_35494 [Oryza sativa Indica Group]|uniref:F-box domain-containing protein n=1 Tax=Oryza sativa subsp. indica TaxID=39946 RepID=A2ZCI9_ORYSI|nr:hypothetical protein OsI_35494 [Oryza sativa Indica Group]